MTREELHRVTDEAAAELLAGLADDDTPPIALGLVHGKVALELFMRAADDREIAVEFFQSCLACITSRGDH